MSAKKSLGLSILALFALVCGTANAAANGDVKILVVFPGQLAPSKVYMVTDGQLARGLLIPFAAIANNASLKKRSEELGGQLDATLAGYDRYDAIYQALVTRFQQRSSMFLLTKAQDSSKYVSEKGVTAAADADGFSYVIVIDDKFSGLSMLNALATKTDDVAPLTTIGFQVYEAKKRSRLSKGNATSNGLTKKPFREAVIDKPFFTDAYPRVADNIANFLVGTLFQSDVLHAMAASVGRGAEVPQVSAILKKNEKRFSYDLKPVETWKRTKMTSKYANVLEPKSDLRFTMGLRFDIDLLIPEFGQQVSSVEEYLPAYLGRLAEAGVDVTTFQEFGDITAPADYRIFSLLPNNDGGRQIVLMRILNKDMIEVVTVLVLKDFDTLYPQHREAIEKMIAGAKLSVS